MKTVYLVAYYFKRPRDNRVKTNRSGWMNNQQNISFDEQIALSRSLRNRDQQLAGVILDLGRKQVVKNTWQSAKSFDQLYDYFSKNYPQYTTEVMQRLDPDYFKGVSQDLKVIEPPVITIPDHEIRTIDTQ